ncbi:MAG: RIP metalloprotease RseP, partial [Bacilli bacterium]
TTIITKNWDRFTDVELVEVVNLDVEKKLFLKGTTFDESEKTWTVANNAVIVDEKEEMQIAPYDRQFQSKSVGARSLAILAGPVANFVLAFVLFIIIGLVAGIPTNESKLGEIKADSVAEKAGLQKGDEIVSIDGQPFGNWREVTAFIQKHPNEQIEFTVKRGEEKLTIPVTPEEVENAGTKIGMIGVYEPVKTSVIGSIQHGFVETWTWMKQTVMGFVGLITGQFGFDALSGPVGIFNYTGEIAQTGFLNLLKWTAVLSINLGIINLVPLPALDGGRLIFFAFEAVRGKPIDPRKESLVHFVGFALLMLLMIVVTWNDIKNLFM